MGTEATTPSAAPSPNHAGAATASAPGKVLIKSFPLKLGESNGTLPYVLFKIYRTQETPAADPDPNSAVNSVRSATLSVASAADKSPLLKWTAGVAGGVYVGKELGGGLGGFIGGILGGVGLADNAVLSGIDIAAFALGGVQDFTTKAKDQLQNFSVKRNQVRMDAMIAMFMPEGINSTYGHDWGPISQTAVMGKGGLAMQSIAAHNGEVKGQDPFIAEAAGMAAASKLGEEAGKFLQFGMSGKVVNPQLELLYTAPQLREFTFDFRLVPRNQQEVDALFGGNGGNDRNGIINLFKFFSAPKIPSGLGGRYYIPPAQFEIEFHDPASSGGVNGYLFKTKKCVLKNIMVNYEGGGGYYTFNGGAPVEVRLQLQFQETVLLSQDDFSPDSTSAGF